VSGSLRYRRRAAGALDVSGRDRAAFLQGLATNDFRTLSPEGALWAAALSPVGKVLFTFRAAPRGERIRLLLSPGRVDRAGAHLRKHAVFQDARVDDPGPLVRFDLYGPEAPPAPPGADAWPPFFELRATWLLPEAEADAAESGLVASGAAAAGGEEAEAQRILAGRPADGRDVDESRTPDESGLAAAVSTTKGCYVGQEVVARMRTYGRAPRRLVRFLFDGTEAVAPGTRLVLPERPAEERGRISSSAVWAGAAVALGHAARDVADGAVLCEAGASRRRARVEPLA
jgi:folate-binding protein YgfZ